MPPLHSHTHCQAAQASPSSKSQRAVSANALLNNDVSYQYCQVYPDYLTINNNFFHRLRQLTQLSFVSLLSGLS